MLHNIELPKLLNMPPKMLPIITDFNKYKFFVIKGGRGSGKTQSVGRLISYLTDTRRLRVICGREIQDSVDESVYTVFTDLIENYSLSHKPMASEIRHDNGSTIKFKGFRERGAINVKGMEGVDIVWIDEAQSISKMTLDYLVPTIVRKDTAKIFFTMNPLMRDDAVLEYFVGREDTLVIDMNYYDNPFCSQGLKNEALLCKEKSEKEYNHIWLGIPLSGSADYLFNYDHLYRAYDIKPMNDCPYKQRVLSIDFAAQGDDDCVATILDRVSMTQWKRTKVVRWGEPDAMVSVGRIINLIGTYKPDIAIMDVGGMGHVVHNRLIESGVRIERFDGAEKSADDRNYINCRAEGYYMLKDWFDQQWIIIEKDSDGRELVKQLEKIKVKYRSTGKKAIEPKVDMKKELKYSPDDADSLMMGVFAINRYIGKSANMGIDVDECAIRRAVSVSRKKHGVSGRKRTYY